MKEKCQKHQSGEPTELMGGLVVRNEREETRVTPGWVEHHTIALCRETEGEPLGEGQ